MEPGTEQAMLIVDGSDGWIHRISDPVWYWQDPESDPTSHDKPDPDPTSGQTGSGPWTEFESRHLYFEHFPSILWWFFIRNCCRIRIHRNLKIRIQRNLKTESGSGTRQKRRIRNPGAYLPFPLEDTEMFQKLFHPYSIYISSSLAKLVLEFVLCVYVLSITTTFDNQS